MGNMVVDTYGVRYPDRFLKSPPCHQMTERERDLSSDGIVTLPVFIYGLFKYQIQAPGFVKSWGWSPLTFFHGCRP